MDEKDYIGKRGESIFSVLITTWCNRAPLFFDVFLGEKHPTTDFFVELVNPNVGKAGFYVQVKSTKGNYKGKGDGREIDVEISKEDVAELKKILAPVYVVGIDILAQRGFIKGISQETTGGIYGISTRRSLTCRTLKALWKEVDEYWAGKPMLAATSRFS